MSGGAKLRTRLRSFESINWVPCMQTAHTMNRIYRALDSWQCIIYWIFCYQGDPQTSKIRAQTFKLSVFYFDGTQRCRKGNTFFWYFLKLHLPFLADVLAVMARYPFCTVCVCVCRFLCKASARTSSVIPLSLCARRANSLWPSPDRVRLSLKDVLHPPFALRGCIMPAAALPPLPCIVHAHPCILDLLLSVHT